MRHTENASLNPKHRSRTKNENPLLQHTKARGFLFLSSASSTGRCRSFSDDKCFDKRRVLMTAQSSGLNSPHAAGLMLMFWYLRRVGDAYTGTEGKRKEKRAMFCGYSKHGSSCAHDCSARFALQGVRRSRPRWELSGLILKHSDKSLECFSPTCGGTKSYQRLCA